VCTSPQSLTLRCGVCGSTAEIMKLEFQVLGKLFFVTVDNPSQASISKAIFMSRTIIRECQQKVRIDALNARDLKAEFDARSGERTQHRSACSINMNWNIDPSFGLIFVKKVRNLFDRFIMPSISRSENGKNSFCKLSYVRGLPMVFSSRLSRIRLTSRT
jgi:hypothetical protein